MTIPNLKYILYVEDDPDIRTIVVMILEKLGRFKVLACNSGQQALEKVLDFSPELVLLDVMMPGMDGPKTLEALRQQANLGEVPVVFMTAKAQSKEIECYKELGVVDVIAKPFDPMTLVETIRNIWVRCHG